MDAQVEHIKAAITRFVWPGDVESLPLWRRFCVRALQVCIALVHDFLDGQLTLRAMSLVYTTLLSLVPLLALTFSVLKGFGVHNQLEPLLLNFLAPLGEKGTEIAGNIVGFVENIKVGVLGTLGLGLLVYTVISLLHKIEQAFNYTWHIRQSRPLSQRFSEYLSVLLVGPLLIFSALGLTASMMSSTIVQRMMHVPVLGAMVSGLGSLIPYAFVIAAFTFLYIFIPNTRVRFSAALTGGVVAGFLWETIGLVFGSFAAGSTNYTAIYSGFAILILFMIWLFISWLILLLGASIAFYVQHPHYLTLQRGDIELSPASFERLALLTLTYIGRRHYRHDHTWGLDDLSDWLGVPQHVADMLLKRLYEAGLLLRTGEVQPAYVPAMELETMQLKPVLDALRASSGAHDCAASRVPSDAAVDALLAEIDAALGEAVRGRSMRDLVLGEDAAMSRPVKNGKSTLTQVHEKMTR